MLVVIHTLPYIEANVNENCCIESMAWISTPCRWHDVPISTFTALNVQWVWLSACSRHLLVFLEFGWFFDDICIARPHSGAKIKGTFITLKSIRFKSYFNKRRHSACQRVACQSGCKMQLPSLSFSTLFTIIARIFFRALEICFSNANFLCDDIKIAQGLERVTHLSRDMWYLPALLCDGQGWKFCIIYAEREMWKFCIAPHHHFFFVFVLEGSVWGPKCKGLWARPVKICLLQH